MEVERNITVVVVDDQELFRHGLRTVLALEAGFEVVAEVATGEDAVARVTELVPDVVLMDVAMPGAGGIDATRAICETVPTTKVVMLTASDDEDDLYAAMRAGANGYLLKDSSLDEVTTAVRAVARGESLVSPSIAFRLLSEFSAATARSATAAVDVAPRLSERETEVLKLVAQGKTNREAAGVLTLSENTVKNHVANILDKLHLRSRLEAALYAVRSGMVDSSGGDGPA
jgi:DNA-binding NarL/FixJ family response regulator